MEMFQLKPGREIGILKEKVKKKDFRRRNCQ